MLHPKSHLWLFSYLKKHLFSVSVILVASVIEPLLYLYVLYISSDIVQVLELGGVWSDVRPLFNLLFPVVIVQVVLFFLSSFTNEVLAHRVTTDMTYDLFNTLQSRSLSYHDGQDVGEIMSRATNDTRSVNIGLSPGVRMIIAVLTIWAFVLYVMFTFNIWIMVLGIISLIIFFILLVFYSRDIAPLVNRNLEEIAHISGITSDSFSGILDIKSYVASPWVKRKFFKQTLKQSKIQEELGIKGAIFYPDLVLWFFTVSTSAFGIYLYAMATISLGDLVLMVSMLTMMSEMGSEMHWVSFILIQSLTATERLHRFMIEEDPFAVTCGTTSLSNDSSIEFKHVTFSYPSTKKVVLQDLSFRINDSETLAIVGSPGSGKSTITKLIQRLYAPSSGEIYVGGRNILSISNESLRNTIATVEQDVFLFNDSILENIRFGRPDADIDEVIQVAKIAHAHDFISSFPDGYDTIIGDNGVRLSGGQAQRLAIARALLINPYILIFDDGASALDAKTEAEIQAAISEILRTRTTLITTHRLAIIAEADKILILDKGRNVGFGTHEELIHTNLFYRRLFEMHFELPPLAEVSA